MLVLNKVAIFKFSAPFSSMAAFKVSKEIVDCSFSIMNLRGAPLQCCVLVPEPSRSENHVSSEV